MLQQMRFYTTNTHCRHSLSNGNWGDDFPPIDLIHLILPCPDMLCLDPHSLGLDARGCLTARFTSVIEEQGDGGLGASKRTRSHDWMVLSSRSHIGFLHCFSSNVRAGRNKRVSTSAQLCLHG